MNDDNFGVGGCGSERANDSAKVWEGLMHDVFREP